MEASQAAPPILASNLLAAARAHIEATPAPVSSGSVVIDNQALSGGFRYGEITSIAGVRGTGKTLLSYHALTSHLLRFPESQVAIIDTTGSFSPIRLKNVLVYRLGALHQRQRYQHSGYVYQETPNSNESVIENTTSALDRVKVMRVFDLAGVIEAVGEIGDIVDSAAYEQKGAPAQKKYEIEDSEDDLESEGEAELIAPAAFKARESSDHSCQIGMIIIDTIANVVSSLVSKSQTTGQALLVSLMRNLLHLTSRNHICTILINTAVGLGPPSAGSSYKRKPEDDVSIFSSTMGRPALGKTFTYLIDTSIFLSFVPCRMEDAAIAYGDAGSGKPWKNSVVMEILKDRRGGREGRWAAFDIVDEVKIAPCRF